MEKIFIEMKNAFSELLEELTTLTPQQLNAVPFPGSWTAGQVGDHLLKSYDVIETLKGNTTKTLRGVDEKVQEIKEVFLNFEIKMQSPPFIIPSDGFINKEELLKSLKEKSRAITQFVQTQNLDVTCVDFELPGSGALTRLEWIHFVCYHTQRHIHQLKNIVQKIKQEGDLQTII